MKTLKTISASNTLKSKLLLLAVLLVLPMVTVAQVQAFLIHEDQVKPSKHNDYVEVAKEFKALCEKHNFSESWSVAQMDDGTFLTITPVEKFADLDEDPMEDFAKTVGEEKFSNYYARFNQCYDKHGSYISLLNENLSYMPDGMSTTQEGQNYRRWIFMDVAAKNVSKTREAIKAIKDLFAQKNSKMHYRIYQNGFGHVGDRFVAVISAKSALDYEQISEDNWKLLGEEARPLFDNLNSLISSYSEISGWMRPDLSYSKQ